jgi:hypothetical protein
MKELEELYLTYRSNEKVLPRLLEVLDGQTKAIEARIDQLKILKRDIEAYRHHIMQKI